LPALLFIEALLPSAARAASADVLILEAATAQPYQEARESLERALPEALRVQRFALTPERPQFDAKRVRSLSPRVLVPLGSQATAWALAHTRETPIVFLMVLHPVQSGFAKSFDRPGGRVTGAALDIPVGVQLRTLRDLLGARKVGVLFDPAETGTVIQAAERAARRAGMELVSVPVLQPSEMESALSTLQDKVEALWSVPDRTVLGRGAAEQLLLFTLEHKLPLMGVSEQYVRAGALLGMAASYAENGRQAADRVQRVLNGEPPGSIPVARPEAVEVVFNPHVADRLNRRMPAGVRPIRSSFAR
jgi:putative ABC transport system substrate-binding protein